MNDFFTLVRISVGQQDRFESAPDDGRWIEMLKTAQKQSLLGVLATALERLPEDQTPSHRIFMKWMQWQRKIEISSQRAVKKAADLTASFDEAGFRTCVLKGVAVARLYPHPDWRQTGDIDIWAEGGLRKVTGFLRSKAKLTRVVYHHAEIESEEKPEVEVHFTPSWMYNWFDNRRLQRFFAEAADAQFNNRDASLGFSCLLPSFDAVYSLVHIYRHLLDEGVGLRQFFDYYYILLNTTEQERAAAFGTICTLRMKRFAGAVMYVLAEVFGLGESNMLCAPDPNQGAFLLEEIMLAGNFGKFDIRNSHDASEGRLAAALRKFRRALRFLRDYPQEVLWIPVFKTWQFVWRNINRY